MTRSEVGHKSQTSPEHQKSNNKLNVLFSFIIGLLPAFSIFDAEEIYINTKTKVKRNATLFHLPIIAIACFLDSGTGHLSHISHQNLGLPASVKKTAFGLTKYAVVIGKIINVESNKYETNSLTC